MNDSELSRRDFTRLSMAAFSGALAGAAVGCGPATPPPIKSAPGGEGGGGSGGGAAASGADSAADPPGMEIAAVGVEKHVCRGLNACKNQGGSGEKRCLTWRNWGLATELKNWE